MGQMTQPTVSKHRRKIGPNDQTSIPSSLLITQPPSYCSRTFAQVTKQTWNAVQLIQIQQGLTSHQTRLRWHMLHRQRHGVPSLFAPRSKWADRTLANSLPGTFAPWPSRSLANSFPGPFDPRPFRSRERKFMELLFPGTFVPQNFRSLNVSIAVYFCCLTLAFTPITQCEDQNNKFKKFQSNGRQCINKIPNYEQNSTQCLSVLQKNRPRRCLPSLQSGLSSFTKF